MKCRSVLPLLFALLLAGAALPAPGQAQDSPADSAGVQSPDATVYVDGLGCPFCAYGIEKKLKNLDAIQQMKVQLEEGRVLVSFKEDQTVTKDEIQKAVKNAGFTARKIEFADESPAEAPST